MALEPKPVLRHGLLECKGRCSHTSLIREVEIHKRHIFPYQLLEISTSMFVFVLVGSGRIQEVAMWKLMSIG